MCHSTHSPTHAAAWSEGRTLEGVGAPLAYAYAPDRPTAVVGLSQKIERELNADACNADGVRIMRRASGGGAVFLCEGVLCFGVIAPASMPVLSGGIHAAFKSLTLHVVETLTELGVEAVHAGISDIAANAGQDVVKLAGTAQLRKRNAVLVHGSLLVHADLEMLHRYLAFPSQVPDYRQGRDHRSFCRTVSLLAGRPVSCGEVSAGLQQRVTARGWEWTAVPERLSGEAEQRRLEKYECDDWTWHRRRPRTNRPG